MPAVTLSGVGKVYPDGTRAVSGLDLEIADGELMVLVGPSGCGKSSTLRMTAGLEEISEGEIRIGERVVNTLDPRQRDVAMVFQNYALYPHMTVFENLAFPLRARRVPRGEIGARVERAARLLGIEEQLRRKPRALSGGQRQRVAMGRALVREPQLFLMDEPLSNLDAKLRTQMRSDIARLQREIGVTTMYVTHDQVEAMTMGTRIAVMRDGRLQQQGPPQQVYDEPDNLFVAAFVGSPAMNLLHGRVERDGDGLSCIVGETRLPVAEANAGSPLRAYEGAEVAVGLRPEHLRDRASTPAGQPFLHGTVRFVEHLGSERNVQLEIDARPVADDKLGDATGGAPGAHRKALITARYAAHAPATAGDRSEVAVSSEHLRFFDVQTGLAIR
jgi:multiple sugar transport system ATP-binding protein